MAPEVWLAEKILFLAPLWLCLTVHEWAHAWCAFQMGDDTALRLGRMTLNPLSHVDPIGTLFLPLLGIPFGWAKPVPVNPNRFDEKVRMDLGMMTVALAGPVSNVFLAALTLAILHSLAVFGIALSPMATTMATWVVQLNVILALFNLIPIPPLDGSRIADALMPEALRPAWDGFSRVGMFGILAILLIPVLFGFSPFAAVLEFVAALMPPTVSSPR